METLYMALIVALILEMRITIARIPPRLTRLENKFKAHVQDQYHA